MPEQEPGINPENLQDKEEERQEQLYKRDKLLEGMIVASVPGVQGTEESAIQNRRKLVGRVGEILDRYRLGVEPDFEYIAEVISYAWDEGLAPELTARSPEEAASERAELEKNRDEQETEFVKGAYERLAKRRPRPT